MTKDEIKALRELAEKATRVNAWYPHGGSDRCGDHEATVRGPFNRWLIVTDTSDPGYRKHVADAYDDARFAAAAMNSLVPLLDYIHALEQDLQEQVDAATTAIMHSVELKRKLEECTAPGVGIKGDGQNEARSGQADYSRRLNSSGESHAAGASDEAGAPAPASSTKCPKCKRTWNVYPCEQSVCIEKRGHCIVCIKPGDPPVSYEPFYEFAYPGHFDWKCQNSYHATFEREDSQGNGHYIKENCPECGKRRR